MFVGARGEADLSSKNLIIGIPFARKSISRLIRSFDVACYFVKIRSRPLCREVLFRAWNNSFLPHSKGWQYGCLFFRGNVISGCCFPRLNGNTRLSVSFVSHVMGKKMISNLTVFCDFTSYFSLVKTPGIGLKTWSFHRKTSYTIDSTRMSDYYWLVPLRTF